MAWWPGSVPLHVEGMSRTSQCRPVHGGYPQPAHWSAWPWSTEFSAAESASCKLELMQEEVLGPTKRAWLDACEEVVATAKRVCIKQ
ncbi:unnamed protein product, partial [Symbiodinium pilosum]